MTIEHLGAGAAFLVNALSYLAVVTALLAMAPAPVVPLVDDGIGTMTRWLAGVRYIRERPALRIVIGTHMVFALVVPPIIYLIPKLSIDVLHVGAGSYGLLLGAFGIGAIGAAVLVNVSEERIRRSRALAAGYASGAVSLVVLAATNRYAVGIVAMIGIGVVYLVVVSINHGAIQTMTDDSHRGRVTSVWLMTFGLCMPVGVIGQGALADHLGVGVVLACDGAALAVLLAAMLTLRLLARLDDASYPNNSE